MMNVILALDSKNGLGGDNKLSWNIPEELHIFKEKTINSIVIVGRKTLEQMPKLKDRTILCISRGIILECQNDIVRIYQDIDDAVKEAKHLAGISGQKIYIIGGNQIYNYFFKHYKNELIVHISFIHNEYVCDTFFDKENLKDFYITQKYEYDLFTHYEMDYRKYGERQYLNLIKDLIENGNRRKTRNAETISDFCKHLKFDLRDGFPLLSTKKMFTKGVVEELLFFIRGDTNTKTLEKKGIHIWKGNTNREFLDDNYFEDRKEGEMGPMYGSIWRNFNSLSSEEEKEMLKESKKLEIHYKSYNIDDMSYTTDIVKSIDFGIDQLKNVIEEIKTNPNSRRLLLTTYNPAQVLYGVLYPCHSITIQFYVQDGFLDMFCYNRSSDVALGLPFNIASSSLLLMIIAKLTNLVPRYFNLTLGDTHLYSNHVEPILEQIKRIPYTFPIIKIPDFETLEDVEKLSCEDFKVKNYKYYPTIKMEMVA